MTRYVMKGRWGLYAAWMRDASQAMLDNRDKAAGLTIPNRSVTINPIRGDKEFQLEIQPHLNAGLWPVYLEQSMRSLPPPTDGREEAPGAPPERT